MTNPTHQQQMHYIASAAVADSEREAERLRRENETLYTENRRLWEEVTQLEDYRLTLQKRLNAALSELARLRGAAELRGGGNG